MRKASTIQYYRSVINRINEYLQMNTGEDLSQRQLADYACVSYHHINEVVELMEKESIGQYIKKYRLEQAAALLTYTDLSVAIVAEKTGYSGKYALTKAFNGQFNVSPGRFRKKMLYLEDSPNNVMDGITSAEAYDQLLQKEFDFSYRIETIRDQYIIATPVKMFGALQEKGAAYDAYTAGLHRQFNEFVAGPGIIQPFNSLNFSTTASFVMHYGKMVPAAALPGIKNTGPYFVAPLKSGQYLAFDIPDGPIDDQIKEYSTLFRENIIGHRKIFRPEDFFTFLLLANEPSSPAVFYLYLTE